MMEYENIRKKNFELISKLGFESNNDLPILEYSNIRSDTAILHRINILHIFYTIYLRGRKSKDFFWSLINKNKWREFLTHRELQILQSKKISEQHLIEFSWYKESIFILLWSLGQIDEDPYSCISEIDISDYYSLMPPERDYNDFITCKLINEIEIIKMLDFYYCLNWSLKRSNNKKDYFNFFKKKNTMLLSLVTERRKALEWIVDSDLNWDDISLDT